MPSFPRGCIAATIAALAFASTAQAQNDNAPAAPPVAPPSAPSALLGSEALGSRAVPVGPGAPLPAGPLTEFGNGLRDKGINLGLTLFNLNYHNPSTGITPKQSGNYGMLFMSAGLDLDKLMGLKSTQLNITEVYNRPAHNVDRYLFMTGSGFTPFPVITTATDLANLTLSHRVMDGKLRIEYGRMNLNNDFMVGNMCSGCILSAPATVLNAPGISKSSWGGTLRYELDAGRTVGLGLLQDNPGNWQTTNGWHWSRGHSEGTIAVANYTQRRGFDAPGLPYKLEAGLFHTSARYDDPLYNTDGSTQAQNRAGTPLRHRGRSGGYFQGRQVLWRGASGGFGGFGAPENIAAYGGLVLTPGASQTYPIEAYAGTEWSGFMPSNPLALVGAGLRYIQLSERRAQFEQQARAGYTMALNMATGGAVPVVDEAVARNMFLFDVHGQIGLVPGVFVATSLQYLKNPNAMIPATLKPIRSGYMFGISLVVDFGVLSGLARMPGDKIF